MTHYATRLKRIVLFIVTLGLFCALSAHFIYSQIKKNQIYQDRLQFRELKTVADNLLGGVEQLIDAKKALQGASLSSFDGVLKGGKIEKMDLIPQDEVEEEDSTPQDEINRGELNSKDGIKAGIDQVNIVKNKLSGGGNFSAIISVNENSNRIGPYLSIPFSNLISTTVTQHSAIFIVRGNGDILLRESNVSMNAATSALSFLKFESVLNEISTKDRSSTLEFNISGTDYRVYYAPYRISNIGFLNELGKYSSEDLFFIGLESKSDFQKKIFRIPNHIAAFLLLFLFIFLSILPLLKVRLVSHSQSLSPLDLKSANYGLICFLAFSTIFVLFLISDFIERQVIGSEGEIIARKMDDYFTEEVKSVMKHAKEFISSNEDLIENNAVADRLLYPPLDKYNNVVNKLENLTTLDMSLDDEKKTFKLGDLQLAFWSSKRFFRTAKSKEETSVHEEENTAKSLALLNIAERIYFQKAINNELWSIKEVGEEYLYQSKSGDCYGVIESGKCGKFFIERIFNLRDGRLSSQFSYGSTIDGKKRIVTFGTKFRAFFQPVLTPGYKFLVFDNITGSVLFHSDENRVLNENVYVQTDNNLLIKELSYVTVETDPFTSLYRGKQHIFVAKRLLGNSPWTLLVMHDLTNQRALFILRMFTIVVYFLITLLFFSITWELLQAFYKLRRRGLLFKTSRDLMRVYGLGKESSLKYTLLYVKFVGGIVVIVVAIIYFLSSQQYKSALSYIFAESANHDLQLSVKKHTDYYSTMYDVISSDAEKPAIFSSSFSRDDVSECDLIESVDTPPNSWRTALVFSPALYFSTMSFSQWNVKLSEKLVSLDFLKKPIVVNVPQGKQLKKCSFSIMNFGKGENNETLYIIICLLCGVAVLICNIPIINSLYIQRLFGLHLARHFRSKALSHQKKLSTSGIGRLSFAIRESNSCYFDWQGDKNYSFAGRFSIHDLIINYQRIDKSIIISKSDNFITELFGKKVEENSRVVLSDIETFIFDEVKRKSAREVVESIVSIQSLSVVIECEVAPLYRLTQQHQYVSDCCVKRSADSAEVYGWSELFCSFEKHYAWVARQKSRPLLKYCARATRLHEGNGWPELREIRQRFDRLVLAGEEAKSKCHDVHPGGNLLKNRLSCEWTSDDIIDYFAAEAGALYRKRWELCTRQERLMLYQIAKGHQPNPSNYVPLEHLVRRGYVYRDAQWFIVNESFSRFVLNAETSETMKGWINEAKDSAWQYFKLPFSIFIILIVALLVYVATDSLETFLTILGGILGIMPIALASIGQINSSASHDS